MFWHETAGYVSDVTVRGQKRRWPRGVRAWNSSAATMMWARSSSPPSCSRTERPCAIVSRSARSSAVSREQVSRLRFPLPFGERARVRGGSEGWFERPHPNPLPQAGEGTFRHEVSLGQTRNLFAGNGASR